MVRAVTNLSKHTRVHQPLFSLNTSVNSHTGTLCTPQPELRQPQSVQPQWHHQVPPCATLPHPLPPLKNPRKANTSDSQLPPAASRKAPNPNPLPKSRAAPAPYYPSGLTSSACLIRHHPGQPPPGFPGWQSPTCPSLGGGTEPPLGRRRRWVPPGCDWELEGPFGPPAGGAPG